MSNTPRYVIDLDKFKENCLDIVVPFTKEWGSNTEFGYSVKTNRDARLINYANNHLEWNIEVVSPDEFAYCKTLGIQDNEIILNGPCKIDLFKKLDKLPKIINLDNKHEVLEFVALFPDYKGLIGLRVNFDLESKCPGETTSADEVSRFGIDADSHEFIDCVELLKANGITNIGLHLHTSTKSRSIRVFTELAQKSVELKKITETDFKFIDIGGGFFGGQKVPGKPTMKEYANAICSVLKSAFNPEVTKLILEPGASVLATCITYETRIINRRTIRGVEVLTVDGTLLHINPFMNKRIQPFAVLDDNYRYRKEINKQIVGGATCMENDRLAVIYNEKELNEGDVLSFKNVGAYTMSFNSYFILNPPSVIYLERCK